MRFGKAAETALASGERDALEALLRKEGIYSSHFFAWRQQLTATESRGMESRKPGRKPTLTEAERELLALKKKNAQLEQKLKLANAVIDLQKKVTAA